MIITIKYNDNGTIKNLTINKENAIYKNSCFYINEESAVDWAVATNILLRMLRIVRKGGIILNVEFETKIKKICLESPKIIACDVDDVLNNSPLIDKMIEIFKQICK